MQRNNFLWFKKIKNTESADSSASDSPLSVGHQKPDLAVALALAEPGADGSVANLRNDGGFNPLMH